MPLFLKGKYFRQLCEKVEIYVSRKYSPPKPEKPQEPKETKPAAVVTGSQQTPSDVRFSIGEVFFDPREREEEDAFESASVRETLKAVFGSDGWFGKQTVLNRIENRVNMSFSEKLVDIIRKKGLKPSAVYHAARVDRKLFSKIVSDASYKPSKDTCLAILFALRLNLKGAKDMLSRAGYTLSHSSVRDIVLEYFFLEHIYNLDEINEILYRMDEKLL